MLIVTPMVSIKPNYLTTYLRFDSTNSTNYNNGKERVMPESNKHDGLMSAKANKRVRLAIDWLIHITKEKTLTKKGVATNYKFKLNFITLTLSSKQKHSDNEIKKTMLNQFLTELRTKYGCTNYLWRAEAQSNGNIHFHIASDVYVPWRSLRTDWNRIQEKLGYISRFTEKTGKVDPNSTDVHSIKYVKDLSSYLAKYCSKNSKGYTVLRTRASKEPFKPKCWLTHKWVKFVPYSYNKRTKKMEKAKFFRQINGKLWGLSQQLSKLNSAKCEIIDGVEDELRWIERRKKDKIKFLDKVSVVAMTVKDLMKAKCNTLVTKFNNYVNSIISPHLPPEPMPIIEQVKEIIKQPFTTKCVEGIYI